MHWTEFETAAPGLAQLGRELISRDELVFVGTLRRDGSPRISPVEPDITGGRLYLGMIWQSLKALDLLRDPRCAVHTVVHDRMAAGGEFKLNGQAIEISDLDERARYGDAMFARIGWRPPEPHFHLFAVDINSAGSFLTGEISRVGTIWREGYPERKFEQFADGRKEWLDS